MANVDLIENHPLRPYERHLTRDELNRVRSQLVAALLDHRLDRPHPVTQRILNDKVRLSLHDIVRWGEPVEKQRAWSSSDFVALLEAGRLTMVPRAMPQPDHRAFCPVQPVRDFRTQWIATGADGLSLEELIELGERKESGQSPMADGLIQVEKGRLRTFHRRIGVSRHLALAKESASWLRTVPRALVGAAYRKEAAEVYQALESNPNLNDGQPWFVPSQNEASAGVPITDAVKTAIDLFSGQKLPNGELLGLRPKVLVVPSADALAQLPAGALRLLEGMTIITRAGLNHAYLFADPDQNPTLLLLSLDENGDPLLEALTPKQAGDSRDVAVVFGVTHDVQPLPVSRYGVVRVPIV